jgi:hypothetical protein
MHQALICRLGVSTRLQPSPEFRVMNERNALVRFIENEGATGEMRLWLMPRERILQGSYQRAHLRQARGFFIVVGRVRVE